MKKFSLYRLEDLELLWNCSQNVGKNLIEVIKCQKKKR